MRRLRNNEGFTIVELLTAMLILIVALGGITYLFASNNDSSLASQREVSQLSVLQQQIENVHQLVKQYGFSALAMSANPAQPTDSTLPTDPSDPNDFITGWGTSSEAFRIESDYNNTAQGVITDSSSSGEELLDPINGFTAGHVTPVQYTDLTTGTTFTSASSIPAGDPYATVYTYVTEDSTIGCNTALGSCPASDTLRVIVAVLVHNPGASNDLTNCTVGSVGAKGRCDLGPSKPAYATTVFVNPVASNQTNTPNGLTILGIIS